MDALAIFKNKVASSWIWPVIRFGGWGCATYFRMLKLFFFLVSGKYKENPGFSHWSSGCRNQDYPYTGCARGTTETHRRRHRPNKDMREAEKTLTEFNKDWGRCLCPCNRTKNIESGKVYKATWGDAGDSSPSNVIVSKQPGWVTNGQLRQVTTGAANGWIH